MIKTVQDLIDDLNTIPDKDRNKTIEVMEDHTGDIIPIRRIENTPYGVILVSYID